MADHRPYGADLVWPSVFSAMDLLGSQKREPYSDCVLVFQHIRRDDPFNLRDLSAGSGFYFGAIDRAHCLLAQFKADLQKGQGKRKGKIISFSIEEDFSGWYCRLY